MTGWGFLSRCAICVGFGVIVTLLFGANRYTVLAGIALGIILGKFRFPDEL